MVVVAVLLAPSLARADEAAVADDIVSAIRSRNAADVAKYVTSPVRVYDLWFDDVACRERFFDAKVDKADIPALVACLAPLGLHEDGYLYSYDPGVRVQVTTIEVDGHRELTSIHAIRTVSTDAAVAEIDHESLERHRTSGSNVIPASTEPTQAVMLELCIDGHGRVTSAKARIEDLGHYAHIVQDAAWKWRFKPFVVRGKNVAVCAVETINNVPPPPPLKPGPPMPMNIAPHTLEAQRMSGSVHVEPADSTKLAIADAKRTKVIGSFKLCIDDHGRVTKTELLHSTGFSDYDNTLVAAMKTWTYSPFLVNSEPRPVCTALTFIYTDH